MYKMIGDINRKWQPKQRAIRDSNGKLLNIEYNWHNTTMDNVLQRTLHDTAWPEGIHDDLVKELKASPCQCSHNGKA